MRSRRIIVPLPSGAGHQAKRVALPRTILTRRVAMTAPEKKFVERNLDLIFEFEKYVLEHPAIAEKIPRDAVVFMKVIGDQSLIVGVSARRKAGEKRRAAYLNHGEKNGTRSFS